MNIAEKNKKILILGLGYVGLTFAIHCCKKGYHVTGIDTDEKIISSLSMGKAHFLEEGINDLILEYTDKSFFFSSKPKPDEVFDYVVISVGTPFDKEEGVVKLNALDAAIDSIKNSITSSTLVLLRSTVSVTTSRKFVASKLRSIGIDSPKIAFSPERTIEGKALVELETLPQIIGAIDSSSMDLAKSLFNELSQEIIEVESLEAAELIKLFNNTYRDCAFAISNTFNNIAQDFGIDGSRLIDNANLNYPRCNIALPGFVAGPCLEKDAYILVDTLQDLASKKFILSMRNMNEMLEQEVANKIIDLYRTKDLTLPILLTGMAFKGQPSTNDLRGSSSTNILKFIQDEGIECHIHDFENTSKGLEDYYQCQSLSPNDLNDEALNQYEIIMILNNHTNYKKQCFIKIIENLMKRNDNLLVFDSWKNLGRLHDSYPQNITNIGNIYIHE